MPKKVSTIRGGMKGVRPARSNAGGATRGKARASLVHTMNAAKASTRSAGSTLPAGNLQAKSRANVVALTKAAQRKSVVPVTSRARNTMASSKSTAKRR